MKVVAISDLHGILPKVPRCDLLIIAGDVCPIHNHDVWFQYLWLEDNFANWLHRQPAKEIVGIAGNHDFALQKDPMMGPSLPWKYLLDKEYTYKGFKIYGTPWVPNLPSWAFYADTYALTNKFMAIPDDVDILITHGPPKGIMDISSPKYGSMSCGSQELTQRLSDMRDQGNAPQLHIFGHIHESHGTVVGGDGLIDTVWGNASMLDDNYKPVYEPLEFDL